MSSPEEPSPLNFTSTRGRGRGRGRGGRLRPDQGNRFYYRGSRGRGGSSAADRPAPNVPPEPDLRGGLDTTKIIDTIPAPTRHAATDFPIKNVKYVASYNWVDAEKPTIIVPGAALPSLEVFLGITNSPLQDHQLYGPSGQSHLHCSLTKISFISTGILRSCPSTHCYHCLQPRTRYIARRRHPSNGRLWTSSQTATVCANSCAGLTRRQTEQYAISGSMSSLSAPRLSC